MCPGRRASAFSLRRMARTPLLLFLFELLQLGARVPVEPAIGEVDGERDGEAAHEMTGHRARHGDEERKRLSLCSL